MHAVAVREGETVAAAGDAGLVTFFRSSAKPLQALLLVRACPDLDDRLVAIACASHRAEPEQLDAVRDLLAAAPATGDDLELGLQEGRPPERIHHNCSGKHAGMLAVCRARGWPTEGYRLDTYRGRRPGLCIPALAAAVSRERLFDLFLELLGPLGEVVDVVLETSHHTDGNCHEDLFREHVDLPVLMSHLCDYEDLLTNDGCTGVAVISKNEAMEVQFDEHKLLVVYAHDLEPFERVLRQGGITRDDGLKLITEGEHLHSTEPHHAEVFERLCYRLGVGEPAERVNW